MSKTDPGRFFEDFRLGDVLHHATPRTVGEADAALYTAKREGRNRVCVASKLDHAADAILRLHQLEAACHRDAFDRRNHRDVDAGDGFAGAAERREQLAQRIRPLGAQQLHFIEIASSAEVSLRTPDDDNGDSRVVAQLDDRLLQFTAQRDGDGVHPFGSIERDPRDPIGNIAAHKCHVGSPLLRPVRTTRVPRSVNDRAVSRWSTSDTAMKYPSLPEPGITISNPR